MSTDAYRHVTHPPAPGAPLVFAFHGTGGTEHQFTGLLHQLLPQAGLVAPRGDVSEHGASRFFRRKAEGVYDMADLAERAATMEGFVRAHAALHPGAPLVGLGYSNGANILAAVILRAPDLFRRAALLHPLIPWAPPPDPRLAGLDLLITAGRADPICPWPLTEALIGYFRAQGTRVTTSLHPGGHDIRPGELADLETFLRQPLP